LTHILDGEGGKEHLYQVGATTETRPVRKAAIEIAYKAARRIR